MDDVAAFNRVLVKWTEDQMKNAIAAREAILAENPDNRKMLLDLPFKKLVV